MLLCTLVWIGNLVSLVFFCCNMIDFNITSPWVKYLRPQMRSYTISTVLQCLSVAVNVITPGKPFSQLNRICGWRTKIAIFQQQHFRIPQILNYHRPRLYVIYVAHLSEATDFGNILLGVCHIHLFTMCPNMWHLLFLCVHKIKRICVLQWMKR